MKRGFTLIEIMVVFAILAVLIIMGMNSYHNQINKARDADRKGDLQRIRIAFEDYYNDHNCYPTADKMQFCGDQDPGNLKPYLEKIPCDPITHQPYFYFLDPDYPACGRNFRVLTHLDNLANPIIADLSSYCAGCNYGVSSTNVNLFPTASPHPGDEDNYKYACSGPPTCDVWDHFPPGCWFFNNTAECNSICYTGSPYLCIE